MDSIRNFCDVCLSHMSWTNPDWIWSKAWRLQIKTQITTKDLFFKGWKLFWENSGEKMLNCWCRKQMENNMFVLLNNFQTLISLSHRIFHGIFNTHAKTTRFSENNQTCQQKRGICWKWLPTNCAILHLWLCPQWSLSYPIFVNFKKKQFEGQTGAVNTVLYGLQTTDLLIYDRKNKIV